MHKKTVLVSLAALLMAACGNTKKSTVETAGAMLPVGPAFVADSAYAFCQQQCDFGLAFWWFSKIRLPLQRISTAENFVE